MRLSMLSCSEQIWVPARGCGTEAVEYTLCRDFRLPITHEAKSTGIHPLLSLIKSVSVVQPVQVTCNLLCTFLVSELPAPGAKHTRNASLLSGTQ